MQPWEFDKFWIIWSSCLDQYRTLKQIQRSWGYKGNALYQIGEKLPLWEEMVKSNILEERGTIKKRGVKGRLLYGRMEWVKKYLDELTKNLGYRRNNMLPMDIYSCFPDKEKLIKFLDENRKVFFSLQKLKILFGTKENLRNYGNLSIFCPLVAILTFFMLKFMEEEGAGEGMFSLLLLPIIFNPNFEVNFFDYFTAVVEDLKSIPTPSDLVSKEAVFMLWNKYSKKVRL